MNETKIITNNVPRDIINAFELSERERAEFDYLDWPAMERGELSASFFRYRGILYDLSQFMTLSSTHAVYSPLPSELVAQRSESMIISFTKERLGRVHE